MNVISTRAPTTTAPARNDRWAWSASIEWSFKVDAHHHLVLPVVPTGAYTELTAE